MLLNLSRSRYSAEDFWSWFLVNEAKLSSMLETLSANCGPTKASQKTLDELARALRLYDKRLFPYCGMAADNVREFVVTAEGDCAAFDSVFNLIKASPKRDGWRFIALKQPEPNFGCLQTDNVSLDLTTLHYYLSRKSETPDLLFLADQDIASDEHWDEYQFLACVAAEMVLGEYAAASKISSVSVVTRSRFIERWGHGGSPICELAEDIGTEVPN